MPATTANKRTRTVTVKAPPYPNTIAAPKKLEWLAWYLRDLAKVEALKQAYNKQLNAARYNMVLVDALRDGANALKKEAAESLQYARDDGLLLFAFEGTTVFKNAQVAA